MEAIADGYAEGIALDVSGNISEGSGQNIFIVRDGVIYTPPLGSSILGGITRDSIMTLARDLGYTVTESIIPREALYIADEVFFVGHRGRSHAGPVGRQAAGRQRQARPDHAGRSSRRSSTSSTARSRTGTAGSRTYTRTRRRSATLAARSRHAARAVSGG